MLNGYAAKSATIIAIMPVTLYVSFESNLLITCVAKHTGRPML